MTLDDRKLENILKKGDVVVMPTDTIYGIIGRAEDEKTVERIYKIRKRALNKPCVILIGDISELEKFSIYLSPGRRKIIKKYWPGPVSIIFDCPSARLKYLHRGTETLAFRLPAQKNLQNLLKKTGPLIAPSANPENLPAASNISEAKNYFGNSVDFYMDGGEVAGRPSKIIRVQNDGTVSVLRE